MSSVRYVAPHTVVPIVALLLLCLLPLAAIGSELVAQTQRHVLHADLVAHAVCGRVKKDGAWPQDSTAGCVTAASMPHSPRSPSHDFPRVVQGALAAASFGAGGAKMAGVVLVADADPTLPAPLHLEAVTIGTAGHLAHRPQCQRSLGMASRRSANAGGRLALSGTDAEDPAMMLVAALTANGTGVHVFRHCALADPGVVHTFDGAVLNIRFGGVPDGASSSSGEARGLWVLTPRSLTHIEHPALAGAEAGRHDAPLPLAIVDHARDGGFPHTFALQPPASSTAGYGSASAIASVVVGMASRDSASVPVALRCAVGHGPLRVSGCVSIEAEHSTGAFAFFARTAPFAASVAAAASARPLRDPSRFAVAVGVATRTGFGVRYFGGTPAWQRGNAAALGGTPDMARPVVLAGPASLGPQSYGAQHRSQWRSATDALRFETTVGDPRTAVVGLSSSGATHEVVAAVQQESGHVRLEHHGDAVAGGWTPFGPQSQCSAQCKTGVKSRTRACSAPFPEYGGAPCKGVAVEKTVCYVHSYVWVTGVPSANCLDARTGAPVCGAGVSSVEVTCQRCGDIVADSFCVEAGLTKPASTVPCEAYFFVRGYGSCVKDGDKCGKGWRYEGTCRRCDDAVASLDDCEGSPPLKPTRIACDGELPTMKPFGWLLSHWTMDDTTCLEQRDCSSKRYLESKCVMCDGNAVNADFGGVSACGSATKCRRVSGTSLGDTTRHGPLRDRDYLPCRHSSFHRDFWRTSSSASSALVSSTPVSYQRCPCAAYPSGTKKPAPSTDEIHPTWWHRKRCAGTGYDCKRHRHNRKFLKSVKRDDREGSFKAYSDHVPSRWKPPFMSDSDFLDQGDDGVGQSEHVVTYRKGDTTSEETEGCRAFKVDTHGRYPPAKPKCLSAGPDDPPIEENQIFVSRSSIYDAVDRCRTSNLNKHYDTSSSYYTFFLTWTTRRKVDDDLTEFNDCPSRNRP